MNDKQQECKTEGCEQPCMTHSEFCLRCRKVGEAVDRWEGWIEYRLQTLSPVKKLVVHPEDWRLLKYPMEWAGLPVKPLGVKFEEVVNG